MTRRLDARSGHHLRAKFLVAAFWENCVARFADECIPHSAAFEDCLNVNGTGQLTASVQERVQIGFDPPCGHLMVTFGGVQNGEQSSPVNFGVW
jgi:hypothetical protein